uniref:Uncharacterized protein n=1 Tax=Rhizophagus irregularis (strain DAOM 181602 / DAOM 197198 / MUCL 43194) TaxID=747089 RepID=U9TJK3_RHIID
MSSTPPCHYAKKEPPNDKSNLASVIFRKSGIEAIFPTEVQIFLCRLSRTDEFD